MAEAELSLKEHKLEQRFQDLDLKAEALDRQKRELNLIVYNVQQTAEEADGGMDTFGSLLTKCMPISASVKMLLHGIKPGWVHIRHALSLSGRQAPVPQAC